MPVLNRHVCHRFTGLDPKIKERTEQAGNYGNDNALHKIKFRSSTLLGFGGELVFFLHARPAGNIDTNKTDQYAQENHLSTGTLQHIAK
ncbi:hypothetical protein FQZ97_950280 [compost metagenome]